MKPWRTRSISKIFIYWKTIICNGLLFKAWLKSTTHSNLCDFWLLDTMILSYFYITKQSKNKNMHLHDWFSSTWTKSTTYINNWSQFFLTNYLTLYGWSLSRRAPQSKRAVIQFHHLTMSVAFHSQPIRVCFIHEIALSVHLRPRYITVHFFPLLQVLMQVSF